MDVNERIDIGGNWIVSVSTGMKNVDIRKWFYDKEHNLHPTKIGMSLKLAEWDKLKIHVGTIHVNREDIAAVQPCFFQDDHLNASFGFGPGAQGGRPLRLMFKFGVWIVSARKSSQFIKLDRWKFSEEEQFYKKVQQHLHTTINHWEKIKPVLKPIGLQPCHCIPNNTILSKSYSFKLFFC